MWDINSCILLCTISMTRPHVRCVGMVGCYAKGGKASSPSSAHNHQMKDTSLESASSSRPAYCAVHPSFHYLSHPCYSTNNLVPSVFPSRTSSWYRINSYLAYAYHPIIM